MKFIDVLRRYHISPLAYGDGSLLEEKDYMHLFKFLNCYMIMKGNFDISSLDKCNKQILERIKSLKKRLLIPLEEEEVMDIVMKQEYGEIKSNIMITEDNDESVG